MSVGQQALEAKAQNLARSPRALGGGLLPVLHPYLVEGMKQPQRHKAPKREEGRKAERRRDVERQRNKDRG